MLDENLKSCFAITLQHSSRQSLDMGVPDALRESFRAACLASCYFGGGVIKVRNWAPGLTLRVALGEGTWLADLSDPEDVIRRLNVAADTFDKSWGVVDYDIRAWLSNPRQPPVHAVKGQGNTTVCWSSRTTCIEVPAMTWDACWPGMPRQRLEDNAERDYRGN